MKTIKIGKQEWSLENLTTDVFRDGTYLEQAETWEEWKQFGKDKVPALCYYDKNNDGLYDVGDNVFEKFYNSSLLSIYFPYTMILHMVAN